MRIRVIYGLIFLVIFSMFINLQAKETQERNFETHLLFHPQFHYEESHKKNTSGSEFYIRRVKFIFSGNVAKDISFMVGFINKDFGLAGENYFNLEVKDAYVEYKISRAFKINFGQVRLCMSRHMQQNSKRLHGMDYHSFFLVNTGDFKLHDLGVVFRGLLFNDKIDYRFAFANGKQETGEIGGDKNLRYIGRIGYNFFEPEPEFFWAGTFIGKRKVLSVGLSYDMEPGVGGEDGNSLYRAIAFDAFAEIPMGKNGIVSTFNYYNFNEGTIREKGQGFWVDFGYRINKLEPMIAYEWYKPDKGEKDKRISILPGINYWLKGYNSNIKVEFGWTKMNDADEWDKKFIFQTQLFY